ncbi:hypothetical protein [Streptomyces sp. 5-10]|uniref:hypothetical protein n=1 Tax=Streptomyces sp. 5-10 TaxID=878925 RepID=UPI00168A7C0C|nr:hypothetical protein [Streptomyces sp. 5-10]MBD3004901.1 hypothetical protein [Streptomyces sp. 5-10]
MSEPLEPERNPDLKSIAENMRKVGQAFERVGESAKAAVSAQNGLVIAGHPDLNALNLELNNLYGNSFE